jgi:hypothetical protein
MPAEPTTLLREIVDFSDMSMLLASTDNACASGNVSHDINDRSAFTQFGSKRRAGR